MTMDRRMSIGHTLCYLTDRIKNTLQARQGVSERVPVYKKQTIAKRSSLLRV
jgi:hypothetical protein